MCIITDGKNYVMENPMKAGIYLATTAPHKAKQFTLKQARDLLANNKKSLRWMKQYDIIDNEGIVVNKNYRGNANTYIGKNDIKFDDSIIDNIIGESNSIISLSAWSKQELDLFAEKLSVELSKCDCAVSDIQHAMEKYREETGKKPQAHRMSKLGYMLNELRYKHKKIKECLRLVTVMQNAIDNNYTLDKIKNELNKKKDSEYKGRTEYYQKALDILEVR